MNKSTSVDKWGFFWFTSLVAVVWQPLRYLFVEKSPSPNNEYLLNKRRLTFDFPLAIKRFPLGKIVQLIFPRWYLSWKEWIPISHHSVFCYYLSWLKHFPLNIKYASKRLYTINLKIILQMQLRHNAKRLEYHLEIMTSNHFYAEEGEADQ